MRGLLLHYYGGNSPIRAVSANTQSPSVTNVSDVVWVTLQKCQQHTVPDRLLTSTATASARHINSQNWCRGGTGLTPVCKGTLRLQGHIEATMYSTQQAYRFHAPDATGAAGNRLCPQRANACWHQFASCTPEAAANSGLLQQQPRGPDT